jgi:adenylate cyclase
MGQEIERKYLVDHHKWQQIDKPSGQLYRQGYLLTDPNKTIRVRQTPEKGFLTIKGLSIGATRPEYEYEIPLNEAKELLDNFSTAELSQVRYKIIFDNKIWEVDEFLGDNTGLIVAEIELTSEDEGYSIPAWVDREVTGQEKYYNSNLTIDPYKNWESK